MWRPRRKRREERERECLGRERKEDETLSSENVFRDGYLGKIAKSTGYRREKESSTVMQGLQSGVGDWVGWTARDWL